MFLLSNYFKYIYSVCVGGPLIIEVVRDILLTSYIKAVKFD